MFQDLGLLDPLYTRSTESKEGVQRDTGYTSFPSVRWTKHPSSASECFAEFVGTFYIALAVILGSQETFQLAVLTIALVVVAVTFGGGHISGAHYNPAVTFAAAAYGAVSWGTAALFIVCQLLGSIFAILIASGIRPQMTSPSFSTTRSDISSGHPSCALLSSTTFSAAAVYIFLCMTRMQKGSRSQVYGVAAGLLYFVSGVVGVGPVGGMINPALATSSALSSAIMSDTRSSRRGVPNFWVYWVSVLLCSCIMTGRQLQLNATTS